MIEEMVKGSKPYFLGPRGGKYEDRALTIHYREDAPPKAKKAKKPEYEPPTERYSDEKAIERLIDFGDSLHEDQSANPRKIDDSGFSSRDVDRWYGVRGNIIKMRKMLKKYHRQISKDEYHKMGLSDPIPVTMIEPYYHKTYGSLVFPVDYLGGEVFDKFREINAKHGVRYFGGVNQVKQVDLDDFDFEEYRKDLGTLGIMVKEPKGSPKAKEEKKRAEDDKTVTEQARTKEIDTMSADEVIKAIADRQVRDTIAVKHDEKSGMFKFYATYSESWNKLFNKNSGMLTGITEFEPGTYARKTDSLELAEEALKKIKRMFPDWDIVTDGLKEARIDKDHELASLRIPIPEVQEKLNSKFKLFDYQNAGVRFLDKTNGNALLGDEMGLGKTLQTLAWAAKNNKKVLVVSPKNMRNTWLREAVQFFPDHYKVQELDSADLLAGKKIDLSDKNLAVVTYASVDKFRDLLEENNFDTMVLDESHYVKNAKSQRTKVITSMAKKMNHHILLSGTAVTNKPTDLHAQLNIIAPGKYSKSSLKPSMATGVTYGGVWHMLREVYLARLKEHVLKDLPKKATSIVSQKVKDAPDVTASTTIDDITRLKTDIAKAKVSGTINMIDDILENSNSKMLVFTESVEAAEKLAEHYGDLAILHHGSQAIKKRNASVDEWQKQDEAGNFISSKRVFVTTRQSMAEGKTLTAADKVVFNDLPWTAGAIRQAEARAHRVGQKKFVNVYWITAEGNKFDENVSRIIRRKFELNKMLNSGQTVTPEEREWLDTKITKADILRQVRGDNTWPEPPVQRGEVDFGESMLTDYEETTSDDVLSSDDNEDTVTAGEPETVPSPPSEEPPSPPPTKPKEEPKPKITVEEINKEPKPKPKPKKTKTPSTMGGEQLGLFGGTAKESKPKKAEKTKPKKEKKAPEPKPAKPPKEVSPQEAKKWVELGKLKQGVIRNMAALPRDLRVHLTETYSKPSKYWKPALIPGVAVKMEHKGETVVITASEKGGKPIYHLWKRGKSVEASPSAVDAGWKLGEDKSLEYIRKRALGKMIKSFYVLLGEYALSSMQ